MDRSPFARTLAAARHERGLSQRDLAAELGVAQGSVSQWELDKSRPSRDRVFAIERALGLATGTLSRFLGFGPPVDQPHRPERRQVSVIDALHADRALDTEQRRLMIALYREMTRAHRRRGA